MARKTLSRSQLTPVSFNSHKYQVRGLLIKLGVLLTGSLQTKRDLAEPYPLDAAIFERAKNFRDRPEEFSDLFKEDLIEATGLVAHSATRNLEASPYLKALLHRSLKCNEVEEKIDPLVETSMMYTSVIGVETLNEVTNINETVGRTVLELHWGQRGIYPAGKLRVF